MSSEKNGMFRSLWKVLLVTYKGTSTIVRRTLDWRAWIHWMFESLVDAHSCIRTSQKYFVLLSSIQSNTGYNPIPRTHVVLPSSATWRNFCPSPLYQPQIIHISSPVSCKINMYRNKFIQFIHQTNRNRDSSITDPPLHLSP